MDIIAVTKFFSPVNFERVLQRTEKKGMYPIFNCNYPSTGGGEISFKYPAEQ